MASAAYWTNVASELEDPLLSDLETFSEGP